MLPKTLAGSKVVLKGARFDVRAVDIRGRGGASHRREIIVHPGAVVVLPFLDEDTVVLIRNKRVAVGSTIWELPAGTLEPAPETPRSCAARELIEETGYRAARLRKLTTFFTSPGICTEVMHAFAAHGLRHVGQELEDGEHIVPHPTPWKKTIKMVRDGEIRDGKSIATILFYEALVRDRK